jgi:hypothetical protein
MLRFGLIIVAGVGLLCGCAQTDFSSSAGGATTSGKANTDTATVSGDFASGTTPAAAMAANLDASDTLALLKATWSTEDETAVTLNSDTATVNGLGAKVTWDTITITAPGDYRFTGTLHGQVVVDVPDSNSVVRLILDGANITGSTGPAIAVDHAARVALVLTDGSQNSLADAQNYGQAGQSAAEAALYSDSDLAISGTGSLSVIGSNADGISCEGGLVADAAIDITAEADGIHGRNYLILVGGQLDVEAGGDGLRSDNQQDATAGYVDIQSGTVSLDTDSFGIQASTDVIVSGGLLDIDSGSTGATAESSPTYGLSAGVGIVIDGAQLQHGGIDVTPQSTGESQQPR